MDNYQMTLEFQVENSSDLKKKILHYFRFYNFNLIHQSSQRIEFKKKTSLLDSWIFNPLKWKSEIVIQLTETNKILIDYSIDTNGQFSHHSYQRFCASFLQNLVLYINHNTNFEEANNNLQILARKNILSTVLKTVSGGLAGLILGFLLTKLTDVKMLTLAGLVIGCIITNNILTRQPEMKNAL